VSDESQAPKKRRRRRDARVHKILCPCGRPGCECGRGPGGRGIGQDKPEKLLALGLREAAEALIQEPPVVPPVGLKRLPRDHK